MAKSVVRITSACALALLASCQLNDHDSAPRAPDAPYDDSLEQFPSPAEVDSTGGRRSSANGADAGADNDLPPQTSTTSGDAAVDGGNLPPGFPPIPMLEAGTLPQGNFGTESDGATIPLPPGF